MTPEQVNAARATAKDFLTTWFWAFPPQADPIRPPAEIEYLMVKEWLPLVSREYCQSTEALYAFVATKCEGPVNEARGRNWDAHCLLLTPVAWRFPSGTWPAPYAPAARVPDCRRPEVQAAAWPATRGRLAYKFGHNNRSHHAG
jgi:hypothetical protein